MAYDKDRPRSFRTTPGGSRLVPISAPRPASLTPFRSALGFAAAKKEPARTLIVVMSGEHVFLPSRMLGRVGDWTQWDCEVIVACAGQPVDLAAIHARFPAAQFLIAPSGTSDGDLRLLAMGQATGDIVALVGGAPASASALSERDRAPAPAPAVSVIVPVHNQANVLDATLSAIVASSIPRESYELIVIDDGSTDGSSTVGARHADTVVRLTGRSRGMAYARNRGTEAARGDVVVFVDADVKIQRDTLERLLSSFDDDSGLGAVCAANDGSTADGGVAAQYWSALQQYGARRHGGLGALFSDACGAVRRNVLMSVGMYNEWVFRRPSLEDLDLGQRVQRIGQRVLLQSDLPVARMSSLRLRDVIRAAWSDGVLLTQYLGYAATRRRGRGHALHVLAGPGAIASALLMIAGIAAAAIFNFPVAWPLIAGATLLTLVSADLLRFLASRRSIAFAVAALPLHLVTQVVTIAGLGAGWVLRHTVGDPAPDATTQAFAEMGVVIWPPVPQKR
ncbi:MAG TPA: glycosyltransferase [Gemmatimonadaceae bacterium]|nr:glycosyltransferase [Gemmatimonadaceae bacterium]